MILRVKIITFSIIYYLIKIKFRMSKKYIRIILLIGAIILSFGCDPKKGKPVSPSWNDTLIYVDPGAIEFKLKQESSYIELQKSLAERYSPERTLMELEDSLENRHGKNHRFKLIGQVESFTINNQQVQATSVDILRVSDDLYYSFVTYNTKGDSCIGGLSIFKIQLDLQDKNVRTNIEVVHSFKSDKIELNDVVFFDNKLYAVGSKKNEGALYMIIELNDRYEIKEASYQELKSYQGTSVNTYKNRVYVTTGDINGGIYVFDITDNSQQEFKQLNYIRDIAFIEDEVYVLQAPGSRITSFNLDFNNEKLIYSSTYESLQDEAKSNLTSYGEYLLVSMNESGFRMLNKEGLIQDGMWCPYYHTPGFDMNKYSTNSLSLNDNLLFVANGEAGIVWYDIEDNSLVEPIFNSTLEKEGESCNFVKSEGSIVFVASGKGGLKILYKDQNDDYPVVVEDTKACTEFLGDVVSLFPEGKNVYQNEQTRSLLENTLEYIEVTENYTDIYVSFIRSITSATNSLGYYVLEENETINSIEDLKKKLLNSSCIKDNLIIIPNIKTQKEGSVYKINNHFMKGQKVVLFVVNGGWNPNMSCVQPSSDLDNVITMSREMHCSFYSDKCNSIVLLYEDWWKNSDMDMNDLIFSISDNKEQKPITKLVK